MRFWSDLWYKYSMTNLPATNHWEIKWSSNSITILERGRKEINYTISGKGDSGEGEVIVVMVTVVMVIVVMVIVEMVTVMVTLTSSILRTVAFDILAWSRARLGPILPCQTKQEQYKISTVSHTYTHYIHVNSSANLLTLILFSKKNILETAN